MFLITVLLLLLNAVEYSSCERFNIVPSPDSSCPGEFTGESCLTLQQYVANHSSNYSNTDIMLELHPGHHHLDSELSVLYNSFMMQANTSAMVICNQQLDEPLNFNRLQLVHISDITFIGCSVYLRSTLNATFMRSSFLNRITNGEALHISNSSVWIEQCTISNNSNGAIYFSGSNSLLFAVLQTIFKNNSNSDCGGALQIHIQYDSNSYPFYLYENAIGYNIFIVHSIFKDNRVENISTGDGGAIYFNGGNVIVLNSTFINNSASSGGGAIYSEFIVIILLVNSTFSHNSAAYGGVIKMAEFHYLYISGSNFTYNRALDQHLINNGSEGAGGVICSRSAFIYATIMILDNTFSHNSAAGDGGVIQAEDSQVTIERSIFSNNTGGRNGGALQTDLYPTRYMITNSSFIDNQAGGDGGAMYVGQAGSHVTIYESIFSRNYAAESGGAISIIGGTLQLNRTIFYENSANIGEVINAYNTHVIVNNLIQEPMVSTYCAPYNETVNTTVSPTLEQTRPTTDHLTHLIAATSLVDDTEHHNLHTTVPGYVAIGISTILFVVFVLFGVIVVIKILRVKPQPRRANHLNTDPNNNEYPPMKDEYTLPEVHLIST